MHRYVFAALLLVLCVASNTYSAGPTYYVDATSGNDSNDGISASWKTIQKAFNSAAPGGTVYIKAGTYHEKLTLNVSGSVSAGYITFMNYGSDIVIVDATGFTTSPFINITNKRYVKIQGLDIRNYISDAGIAVSISGGSDHVEIRRNKLTNIKIAAGTTREVINQGIHAWMVPIRITGNDPVRPNDRIIIDDNDVSNCEEGWAETITVTGNSTNWEITNNRISGCQKFIDAAGHFGDSSNPATDQARNGLISGNVVSDIGPGGQIGIYVDGGKDIIIERNMVMRSPQAWGIVISCENFGKTASGIIVRNNLFYDTANGLAIGGWIASYGRVVNSQVLNNTMVGSGTGIALNMASNITFKNNIISMGSTTLSNQAGNDNTNAFNYNIYYPTNSFGVSWKGTWHSTLDSYRQASGQDAQSLVANPQFVNLTSKDFHLSVSSPAIDRGDPSFVAATQELDIDRDVRVVGTRVDAGADEVVTSVLPSAPTNIRVVR